MTIADGLILERLRYQSTLTAARPRRAELTRLVIDEPIRRSCAVAVRKNHALEAVRPLLTPFLRFAGLDLTLLENGYDDSLSAAVDDDAKAALLWFDLDRVTLQGDQLLDWFAGRVERLADGAGVAVVVVPVSASRELVAQASEQLKQLAGTHVADPWALCDEAGVELIDERNEALTGSRISRDAHVQLARALGARWLPAALLPTRKMVAVDLDETLHHGVIGEDGIEGVTVTPAHRRLHDQLKSLADSGTLLALISRNNRDEIYRLFDLRHIDYGLSLTDFFVIEASWGSKADAVSRAAAAARIGLDSVVFVDDNPGELLSVGLGCPTVALIHARSDADLTAQALRWQPGLWQWAPDEAAAVRVPDLTANTDREQLRASAGDHASYLVELDVRIEIGVDQEHHLVRLAELCKKTNQFNLSTRRLSESALRKAMHDSDMHVVSIGLEDRLSKSGIILILVARRDGRRLVVHELAMSCRAMGRGLESLLVTQALQHLPCWELVDHVVFEMRRTERNLPARLWLTEFSGLDEESLLANEVAVDATHVSMASDPGPVTITALLTQVQDG